MPYLSQFCFGVCDKTFPERAKMAGGGMVVGGANYGQGSSREHAALVPLYLGVKAVIAVSFARMHKANLINSGILPLTFKDPADYDLIAQGDQIELKDIKNAVISGADAILVDKTASREIPLKTGFSEREIGILLAGGKLNYTAQNR